MTDAPEINHTSGLINIHVDGLFYDVEEETSHGNRNTVFPTRGPHSN